METLIRQRGSVKSRLTVFAKYINNLETLYPQRKLQNDIEYLELADRFERFRPLLDEFEKFQIQIELLTDDVQAQLNERETFETGYHQSCSKAKGFLSFNSHFSEVNESASVTGESAVDAEEITDNNSIIAGNREVVEPNRTVGANIKGVRLPIIDIPKYNGEYDSWLEFRDTFDSLIDKNQELSDIQKYHYLRASLGPKILEIIASLDFSSNNYGIAWKLICDRFNNSRILIQNHVKALFSLERVHEESANALRKIVDSVSKHLRALTALNEATDKWDTLIIYLITTKLDATTLRKWEQAKAAYGVPNLENLKAFLREQADLLESLELSSESKKNKQSYNFRHPQRDRQGKVSGSFVTSYACCHFCKADHYIQKCPEFIKLSPENRYSEATKKRLCLNCLRPGHMVKQCRSGSCKTCNARHNSLLHIERVKIKHNTGEQAQGEASNCESVNLTSRNALREEHAILSTILVNVFDKVGKKHTLRCLLDPGSQSSYILAETCENLNLPQNPVKVTVAGINNAHSSIEGKTVVRIHSLTSKFSMQLACLIIPQITGHLPNHYIDPRLLKIPPNIRLADSTWNTPGKVHMLIGADHYWNILCVGQLKLGNRGPFLNKSQFGWFVAGRVDSRTDSIVHCNLTKNIEINEQLVRFWELEELPNIKHLSREEKLCEEHFLKTTKRNEDGKFIVTIPLKESPEKLGDSYEVARRRFLSLERKLQSKPDFKERYVNFIEEYKSLGHMQKVDKPNTAKNAYHMPHHGVLKESSLTTKLRVVFDASCPTSTGLSFNDLQMVGPTIQSDLFTILLRYRQYSYVVAADIEKMYRMCLVDQSQRQLQRILWRDNPEGPIETYELATVTYGTSSAAYLAIRCLYQLGEDMEAKSPTIADAIKHHFYVDDMLTGANTLDETIFIANEVSRALRAAGFHLRKWVSNSREVLNGIKTSSNADMIDLGINENTKTLGMIWSSHLDCFSYKIRNEFDNRVTKRNVLSDISQVFDPLGLLSPCIILVKIVLRDTWCEKLGWDDSLPIHLHTRWLQFRDELSVLNKLVIPRQVTSKGAMRTEIHGFSDASSNAYGACVYLRSTNEKNEILVRLICAKSKVAPLKTKTIPRLELTAALLLARLVDKVKTALKLHIHRTVYWCDSTITLGWINTEPNTLQVFVANRVAAIQELSSASDWRYVPTSQNPADDVSRGLKPSELIARTRYWSGPPFLMNEDTWPALPKIDYDLPEVKLSTKCHATQLKSFVIDFEKYSNLTRLERIVAYCLRYIENLRAKTEHRVSGPLMAIEIENASNYLLRLSQSQAFANELTLLRDARSIETRSPLLKLNPFLDEHGILRVGGRLSNSNFNFGKRHPAVLCSKNRYTVLLFEREHKRLLHAGPQLLLASIREKCWPLNGRNLARKVYHNCNRCFRFKPKCFTPIMGQLPHERVTPAPPFQRTGVDYAGPFLIKDRQGRGCKVTKAYICLFVCFVTRAVHLELVSDLAKESFIAALRRFVGRRGKPAQMYSDNGTNFVGANLELKSLGQFLVNNAKDLTESIENVGISWSFIPAHSPHFGGLWEAGVKSTKHHLLRVAGNALLTFEQFATLLVQIEAILNSRPISPLSSDPSDLTPLTPAHFLIGRPLTSVADPDLSHISSGRLIHWQRIQQLTQNFWARWSLEYVAELQHLTKWKRKSSQLEIGQLVIVKEDNQPPLKWSLARVIQVHPGKDGVVRVASLKTSSGVIRRSFAKLCHIPLQ